MDRTFSSRRYLISTMFAAGAAAMLPACASPELDPGTPGAEPVTIAEKAPPPISGGTLLVTKSGTAVAADSDRDLIYLVDLTSHSLKTVTLNADDEPGRAIEDGAGRVHVALRRSGDVVTIDTSAAKVIDRSPVCPAPRGLAYDAKSDVIHVACAGGELVTLPAAGGAATRSLRLDKDLRDIAISGNKLLISRFRTAELIVVDSDGKKVGVNTTPPAFNFNGGPDFNNGSPNFTASGAWRMVPLAGGGVAVAHQRALTTPVVISEPQGYGGGGGDPTGCNGGIVHPTVTTFDANGVPNSAPSPVLPQASLPVDMAINADGDSLAVIAAGSDKVILTSFSNLQAESSEKAGGCSSLHQAIPVEGAIAVAFWNNQLIVQGREPAALYFLSNNGTNPLILSQKSVADSGHKLFHHQASDTSAIACANCHLEGRDDAHTWMFDTIGARRTQTLGGDIFATTPFHWDGDMQDLGMIMDVVFVNRMGGLKQGPRHVNAMQSWMGQMPRLPVSPSLASEDSIKNGADLFLSTGCAKCHVGELLTNNTNQDVGTGQAFQVPSLLGLSNRAPYLHDGSAATLKDRFGPVGGSNHGDTSKLSPAQIQDLVNYLETL